MPTTANSMTEKPASGNRATPSAPNAAPSVAPMNSEGEKTPPEAPDPRLTEVAKSLPTKSAANSRIPVVPPSRIDWMVA
jgi:hypothetical protein